MRKSTSFLLGEVESKMSGYVALMNYKYFNLCVKAEPASLLSITVEYDKTGFDIEQVADVAMPQENQLQIYPKDPALLYAIGKAIATSHPEFKQDIVVDKGNEKKEGETSDDNENADDADKSILLTMPVVDKDRRDALIDGINLLYNETKTQLDANFSLYTQKLTLKLENASPEEINEAKEALDDIRKQHNDLAKQYHENKEKEIETAYQLYLEKQTEQEKNKQEQEAATNKEAGLGFKMPDMPKE